MNIHYFNLHNQQSHVLCGSVLFIRCREMQIRLGLTLTEKESFSARLVWLYLDKDVSNQPHTYSRDKYIIVKVIRNV